MSYHLLTDQKIGVVGGVSAGLYKSYHIMLGDINLKSLNLEHILDSVITTIICTIVGLFITSVYNWAKKKLKNRNAVK